MTHRRRQNFYALPTEQWQRLAAPPFNLLENLERVDDAIDANADIADEILSMALDVAAGVDTDGDEPQWHGKATASDLDKARSTIRQFFREWSAEGAHERAASNGLVLQALERAFPSMSTRKSIKVLVPGAGLGRLVFDIFMMGFRVEGNEISYHQLMASNWVLNHVKPERKYSLHPYALDFSNLLNREHQLKMVRIPDVNPASTAIGQDGDHHGQMSVSAGDFISVYGSEERKNTFDVVATVFFVDTAPNVIRYIETVRHCLRDGAIWINCGPLLWHFADRALPAPDRVIKGESARDLVGIEAPGSIEMTDSELVALVGEMGFDIEMHEIRDDGQGYIRNPDSMLQNIYRCSFWIAKKRSHG